MTDAIECVSPAQIDQQQLAQELVETRARPLIELTGPCSADLTVTPMI